MKRFELILKLSISIVLIIFLGDRIPEEIQRAFFTISILIKETIIFCMPIIVFSFIFASISTFQKKAPLLILITLTFVVISNFSFVHFGYFAGNTFLPYLNYYKVSSTENITFNFSSLVPYFTISYPRIMSVYMALFLGTATGFYSVFFRNKKLTIWGISLKNKIQNALTNIFIPLIIPYIIGFLFKIHHDHSLIEMFTHYGPMIGLIVIVQLVSILLFYFKANLGKFGDIKTSLKNVFPSGLVAFSTMSSAATMPLTLEAAEKNTRNKEIAHMMISATTNIHHVGDSVCIPILIATVLSINGLEPMNYSAFLVFLMYYMIARFGVASVPGGEIIVLLPILEGHFGFTDSMSGLLTTLYILIDPFITVTNVLSNGALAIFMDKVCGRMKVFKGN